MPSDVVKQVQWIFEVVGYLAYGRENQGEDMISSSIWRILKTASTL